VHFFVEPVADVLAHRQRVEQRAFLEQHADVGADAQQLGLAHVVDAIAVHVDGASVRTQEVRE
jgi:hypothetical protein